MIDHAMFTGAIIEVLELLAVIVVVASVLAAVTRRRKGK
jgi:hypothetical protein